MNPSVRPGEVISDEALLQDTRWNVVQSSAHEQGSLPPGNDLQPLIQAVQDLPRDR